MGFGSRDLGFGDAYDTYARPLSLNPKSQNLNPILNPKSQIPNPYTGAPNIAPTDSPVWIREMASPSSNDTDRIVILGSRLRSGIVTVSVTISSSIGELRNRSTAGPVSSACVHAAYTARAPALLTISAAPTIEPAVSISSSTMIADLPRTSPMTPSCSLVLLFPCFFNDTATTEAPIMSAKLRA